ncbi:MAG: hypothetical protein ACM3ML_23085 [Micromonosporaceae bacterium]
MRTRPNLVAGVAAAALALTTGGITAGTAGGTQEARAVLVSARHAPVDTRYQDMRELAQVKWETAWAAVEPALVWQPQLGTSWFADLGELAKVRRETSWQAAGQAGGR